MLLKLEPHTPFYRWQQGEFKTRLITIIGQTPFDYRISNTHYHDVSVRSNSSVSCGSA